MHPIHVLTLATHSVAALLESVAQAQSHIKTLIEQSEADKFATLLRPETDADTTEKPKTIGLVDNT
jgi:hypothetical protein